MASACGAGDGNFIRFMLKRSVRVARSCKEIMGHCHVDDGLASSERYLQGLFSALGCP
jgi:hypothetical protein